jgi:hypothetical protein
LLLPVDGTDEEPCRIPIEGFLPGEGGTMSQTEWFLLGAVVVGIAVFAYLMFFCPTDCH